MNKLGSKKRTEINRILGLTGNHNAQAIRDQCKSMSLREIKDLRLVMEKADSDMDSSIAVGLARASGEFLRFVAKDRRPDSSMGLIGWPLRIRYRHGELWRWTKCISTRKKSIFWYEWRSFKVTLTWRRSK